MTPSQTPSPERCAAFIPPYPPSWVDRLTDWVDRLPIPWWLFYVLLALPINGAVALVLWQTGIYAAVGFHPMQVFLPSLPVYFLALTHGLDRVAVSSMARFRPAFRGDDSAFAAAVYRMTTLPSRTALVFPVVAALVSVPFGRIEMASLQIGRPRPCSRTLPFRSGLLLSGGVRVLLSHLAPTPRDSSSPPGSRGGPAGPSGSALCAVAGDEPDGAGNSSSTTTAGSWPSPGEIRTTR